TIFVFIAASYTPIALLVLTGWLRWVVLGMVWAGALAGVGLSVAWITAPRVLVAACYLALGWVAVIAVPQLVSRLDVAPLLLLAGGGLLYTAGAAVYAARRPDPWPRVFGFHELFHAFVVLAAVAHFVAMAGWVIPVCTRCRAARPPRGRPAAGCARCGSRRGASARALAGRRGSRCRCRPARAPRAPGSPR